MTYLNWLAQQDLETCTFKSAYEAGAASRDAEITELKAERDTFYMDYRIKCDVETKAAHVERDQLREQLEEMTGKNLVNQNAVRLQKEKVAELREQVKLLREALLPFRLDSCAADDAIKATEPKP